MIRKHFVIVVVVALQIPPLIHPCPNQPFRNLTIDTSLHHPHHGIRFRLFLILLVIFRRVGRTPGAQQGRTQEMLGRPGRLLRLPDEKQHHQTRRGIEGPRRTTPEGRR